ncbi:MAG TPA: hypothetical protein VNU68_34800 [Verrucomicrobiae bacterium]|nr:hypothetical protein [Verrucomicrobiae bacterium]
MKDAPPIHEWTGPTGVKFRDVLSPGGTYYRDTTPKAVVHHLELARQNGYQIRLWLGDAKTGRDWLEEWDVVGKVGRSMGPIKSPLLLRTSRSIGGGIISTDCIVRLFVNGREVYRHPKYKLPSFALVFEDKHKDVPWAVFVNGQKEPHARFKTQAKAQRWAAFMRGERLSK